MNSRCADKSRGGWVLVVEFSFFFLHCMHDACTHAYINQLFISMFGLKQVVDLQFVASEGEKFISTLIANVNYARPLAKTMSYMRHMACLREYQSTENLPSLMKS